DTLFWNPHNYSMKYFGYTRMREGLKKSRNIYAAKLIYDLGPETVKKYAQRFGITTHIEPVYSLAAGSLDLIPYELISAFTTFPNGGERATPIFVRRVEDSQGQILESAEVEKIRVVDEKVAFIMTSLLQSVIDEGTGRGVRWQPALGEYPAVSYKWTAAGKTGTTNDYRDAWFIGFHKKLVTGIWVGFDNNDTLGDGQSGAVAALPSWPYIMKKAIHLESPKNSQGQPIVDASQYKFDKPEDVITVEVSKETGLLPKSGYEKTIREYFIPGTEPTPLSDSLKYNFYPTAYRENEMDSLVIDLGGKRYIWPDSTEYTYKKLDQEYKDSLNYYPTLDLHEDMDSLIYYVDEKSYKAPSWVDSLKIVRDSTDLSNYSYNFYPELLLQNDIDSLYYFLGDYKHKWPSDSILKEKYVPEKIDLRGAKIMKDHKYVTRPDSLLYGPESLDVGYPGSIDEIDKLFQDILKD
ncbi:MAG: penicillin-binding transpeptidase domain-containing protein, partial [Candidatus Cloacimonadota bacterium]|nr:penicillin-binding transpeptidase domain-containing protein [Candidatus Cloacimonadota bacterium]